MPEQQQVTNDPVAWESKYKELQAEFTRKSQQLAEIDKMKEEGRLVEKDKYDEWLVKWASENPDAALEVFPSLKQRVLSVGADSNGSTVRPGSSAPTTAFDEAIFDTNSDAHQKFRQEAADKAFRQALWAKNAPELFESTGLNKELAEVRELKKVYETGIEDLRERVERAEKYAISAYDQGQIAQDPRRKQIRDLQEKLKETKGEAWYEVVEAMNKLKELEAKQSATPPPAAPATPGQPPQSPTPEQLADRINQASVVPQGAGSGSGQLPSQAMDPFDAALAKVDPALAQKLGISTAA